MSSRKIPLVVDNYKTAYDAIDCAKLLFFAVLILIIAVILGLSLWNKNSRNSAFAKVSTLPEVQEYLRAVPNGSVVLDHEDKETNSFIFHVYEIKDGHTVTFNWYEVDKATGKIITEF